MIPILYEKNELTFSSEGIARLVDCVSCYVNEQRNGKYECEFEYPITGRHYSDIIEGRVIAVTHSDAKDIQPFDIYKRSLPDSSGVVKFYARHIKYRQSNVVLLPLTAGNSLEATQQLSGFAINAYPETTFNYIHDMAISWMAYTTNSLITANSAISGFAEHYNVELEYDKFDVYFHSNRGDDNGVEVRYGKNLISIRQEKDASDIYNGVVPYWMDSEGNMVVADGYVVTTPESAQQIIPVRSVIIDFSNEFEEAPTPAQLTTAAQNHLTANKPWEIPETLEVDFVQLWRTEEYKLFSPLQNVGLCDIVTVIYPDIGISKKLKVIEVTYNSLLERYDKIILGVPEQTFAEYMGQTASQMVSNVETESIIAAVDSVIGIISGQKGGTKIDLYNNLAQPIATVYTDNLQSDNVDKSLRLDELGMRAGTGGLAGTYTRVIGLDGKINPDFLEVKYSNTSQGTPQDTKLQIVINALVTRIKALEDAQNGNS